MWFRGSSSPNFFISLFHRLMDVLESKSLFVGPSSSDAKVVLQSLATQPITPIILDSIHAAKHSFSALQLYYHGFLCEDHRKSFPPNFLVLILALMANKKLKREVPVPVSHSPFFTRHFSLAISHIVYFKRGQKNWQIGGVFNFTRLLLFNSYLSWFYKRLNVLILKFWKMLRKLRSANR